MANGITLNIMLGRGRGGIEQATVDYAEALRIAGIDCLTITQPGAYINRLLDAAGLPYQTIRCRSQWDILAAYRLHRLARSLPATHIVTHGKRSLSIALLAGRLGKTAPVIAVAHNYKTAHFAKTAVDAVITITPDLATHISNVNPALQTIVIPNAVRIPPESARTGFRHPPVIGAMGRFDTKKGFEVFIKALAELRSRSLTFEARLGGDGEESPHLHALTAEHGLEKELLFTGWVEDKQAFFSGIDIFIVPSHTESFGLVLIEAMATSLPCIATASEGPGQILTGGIGTLTPLGDATALANAIASYIAYPETALAHGRAARARICSEYSIEALAERLGSALHTIT